MGLPLQGLRVIDLTQDFAGPFCTMILADLGAEVIKIEKPDGGDETRAWGPPLIDGISYYFLSLNRGKKSVVLDLKTRKGQEIIRKLVVDADIFVESSRPGQMARFNLDYPRLRRLNKALVYASISSFGQTGPYRDRLGYDLIAFAMSGIMASASYYFATGKEPERLGSAHPSIVPYQAFMQRQRHGSRDRKRSSMDEFLPRHRSREIDH